MLVVDVTDIFPHPLVLFSSKQPFQFSTSAIRQTSSPVEVDTGAGLCTRERSADSATLSGFRGADTQSEMNGRLKGKLRNKSKLCLLLVQKLIAETFASV